MTMLTIPLTNNNIYIIGVCLISSFDHFMSMIEPSQTPERFVTFVNPFYEKNSKISKYKKIIIIFLMQPWAEA